MTGTTQRDLVAEYFDGFRTSDHPRILATLTDDIEWVIHGHRTTRGKAEFDGEIENPAFTGSPEIDVQRVHRDGPVVVTTGEGRGVSVDHGPFRFAFSDLFTSVRAHRPRRFLRRPDALSQSDDSGGDRTMFPTSRQRSEPTSGSLDGRSLPRMTTANRWGLVAERRIADGTMDQVERLRDLDADADPDTGAAGALVPAG